MKKYSVSQKLFRTYVGWFTIYLIILLCICAGFMASVVSRDVTKTQEQLVKSIDENVQNYFEEMNAFSLELINSDEFKRVAINHLPEAYDEGRSTSEWFSTLFEKAYKMFALKYNVGILVDEEYYMWMGRNYYIHKVPGEEIHTYDNLVRNEVPVVKYLKTNEYLKKMNTGEKDRSYITLSRSMDHRNKFLNGRAILEIQVEEAEFIHNMQKLSGDGSENEIKINLYDSEGNAIYTESDTDFSKIAMEKTAQPHTDNKDIIGVSRVFDDNIVIVYEKDHSVYLRTMLGFWGAAAGLSILIIGATFLITYKISKEISKPIYAICENVQRMNLKAEIYYEEVETDIDELQFLSKSLKQMNGELKESLEQIISLKDYELHAKMLALQAQMQPHFLFNTLSAIAGMAEEEGNEGIYRICMNLNSMFRYIAAGESGGVRMFEEIRHIESYVEIMKERFPDSQVTLDIPLEMMDCIIPKLTIQPLIENAFKYCNRERPELYVTGTMEGTSWSIEVTDNGTGFSEEKKKEIMTKCMEGLQREKTLSNQIDGMGLVNVYVRLSLFYGEAMRYHIEENKGRIVIGGSVYGKFRNL